jgi:hypothetical protein
MYEIQNGPFHGELCSAERPRGPKARYPLRDMTPGDYILVPRAEEMLLWRSARNAKQNHGIKVQVSLTADGVHWHVLRVE